MDVGKRLLKVLLVTSEPQHAKGHELGISGLVGVRAAKALTVLDRFGASRTAADTTSPNRGAGYKGITGIHRALSFVFSPQGTVDVPLPFG